MRIIQLLLMAASTAFGLSNSVTITNLTGAQQTSRVITIPRYFANQEICQFPQPFSNGTAIPYWQADVRNRWPADANCTGGYVKFALITIEQTIAGNGSVTVEFRNAATPSFGGSGLDKTGMLNFDAGSGAGVWPSRGTFTKGGISFNTSARNMLSNDQYKVLENGPLRTSVLVREGPDAVSAVTTRTTSFGWQCTANCVAPYNNATWVQNPTYYSIRPSYVVTFYRSPTLGKGTVETDFLLDNGWMDRAQDQRIDTAVLYRDDTGMTAGYTAPAVFVIPFRSRMFETVWSTDPPSTNIDLNFKYLYYSKVIPAYGPEYTVSAAAENLELNDTLYGFNSKSDQGATVTAATSPHMGKGQWEFYGMQGAGGGSSPGIAVIPRWDVRWLVRQSPGLLAAVLGNAKASFHTPVFYLDASTTGTFRTGNATKSFGRPVSLTAHPTFAGGPSPGGTVSGDAVHSPHGDLLSSSCAAPNCMVTVPYASYSWYSVMLYSNDTVNNWGHDTAHRTGNYFAAYLATGKYVYLEGLENEAAFVLNFNLPGISNSEYAQWIGVIYDLGNSPRSSAWALRSLTWGATFAPDGSVEQGYFADHLNLTHEMTRGRFNINPGGRTCVGFNAATETDAWKMGRCFYENGNTTNVLHQFTGITQALFDIPCYCAVSPQASAIYAHWQHHYVMASLGHALDLGWDVEPILQFMSTYTLGMFADSALQSPLFSRFYVYPGFTSAGRFNYIQSWTDVYNGKPQTIVLAKPMVAGDHSFTIAGTLDTQLVPQQNVMDVDLPNYWWFQADNEMVLVLGFSALPTKAVTAVDTTLDTITIPSHGYSSGEATMFLGTTLDTGMTGGSSCSMDRTGARTLNCWFYLKALDANTLELYTDAALTNKVNLTGGSSGMVSARSTANIASICGNGAGYCRGQFDTAAASHTPGITIQNKFLAPLASVDPNGDADGSHGVYMSSGLSVAVDIGATTTDSLTGAPISAARAYEEMWGSMGWKDRFGGGVNCAGLNISTCDNPVWGIRPRHVIRDVVVQARSGSPTINYTAPTGDFCKVGISSTPFDSTDDSSDVKDQQAILSRSFQPAGLAAGSYHYRITCGPSGGTTRVSGTFSVGAQ